MAAPLDDGLSKHIRYVLAALFLAWLIILIGQVWHNPLERDEGYLNAAATLISRGWAPYTDFIFPQQPYYPLVYGTLFKLWAPSILSARILSLFFYIVLVGLVSLSLLRLRKSGKQAVWGAILLAFNTLCLFWYPRGKHYILADLLLFAAFWLVNEARHNQERSRRNTALCWVVGGLCAAMAIQTRLLLAPAGLLLAGAAFFYTPRDMRLRALGLYVLGAVIGTVPNFIIFLKSPEAWLFNNFALQMVTRPEVDPAFIVNSMGRAIWGYARLPDNMLLLILCAMGFFLRPAKAHENRGEGLALLMTLVLTLAFLAPPPTYRQYWVEVTPYLVIGGVRPWCRVLQNWILRVGKKELIMVCALVFLVLIGGHRAVGRMIISKHEHPVWGMGPYLRYKVHIDNRASSSRDRVVLTWWPGYLVADGVVPYPGSELGRPAYRAMGRLSKHEIIARGLLHPTQEKMAIAAQSLDMIMMGPDSDPQKDAWLSDFYKMDSAFGNNRLYIRK